MHDDWRTIVRYEEILDYTTVPGSTSTLWKKILDTVVPVFTFDRSAVQYCSTVLQYVDELQCILILLQREAVINTVLHTAQH
jgi:hypothetical protein